MQSLEWQKQFSWIGSIERVKKILLIISQQDVARWFTKIAQKLKSIPTIVLTEKRGIEVFNEDHELGYFGKITRQYSA